MAARTLEIVIKGKDEASKALGSVTSGLGKVGKAAGTLALGVGGAAVGIGAGLAKLASDAAPLEGIQAAFEGIAKSSGSSMNEMLGALEEGSLGMVSQTELMKTYNTAAQLVGTTFANQLPEAMGFLGKVSAATGEDMGFMLDSLVKGVGRLSPMILDNLGIQVDMVAANETWADSMGRTVESMTKEEQQAALMAQAMELLGRNTAAMPEVAGTAMQAQAKMTAELQNTKDMIGLELLPVWQGMMGAVATLTSRYLPPLIDFFKKEVVPFLKENVVPALEELFEWIGEFLPQAIDYFVNEIVKGFLIPAMQEIWGFVQGSLIPIINSLASWFSDNLPAAMQAVKDFWDSTLSPALSALWGFVQNSVIPVISNLFDWIATNIPKAFEAAKTVYYDIFHPVLNALWGFIKDSVIPIVQDIIAEIKEYLPKAMQDAKGVWEDSLKPALTDLYEFLRDSVIPTVVEIIDWIGEKLVLAYGYVKDAWNEVLYPVLSELWEFIRDNVLPIIKDVFEWLEEKIPEAFTAVENIWNNTLKPVLEGIGGAFEDIGGFIEDVIGKVESLIGWLGNIQIPDINLPSLPSFNVPWGQHGGFTQGGLVMTHPGEALIPLNNQSGITALAQAMRQAAGNTFNLTANYSNQPRDSLASDVRMLQMVYGR